jgi:hypothetical protein
MIIGSISANADEANSVAATRLDNILNPRMMDYNKRGDWRVIAEPAEKAKGRKKGPKYLAGVGRTQPGVSERKERNKLNISRE